VSTWLTVNALCVVIAAIALTAKPEPKSAARGGDASVILPSAPPARAIAAPAPLARPDVDCTRPSAMRASAETNAQTLEGLVWSPFGRPELGWEIYAPLIAAEIDTMCAPDSPGFAAALARWQDDHGLAATGVLNDTDFLALQSAWRAKRNVRRVPGVFLQNRGNFAQDLRIAIRGFGARAGFGVRGIRVYVDGIPATLPDGQTQLDTLDLASTERIEVIRGPSSSLYGAAAGGVISIESELETAVPFVTSRVAAGSDGYRKYQGKSAGGVGPLAYMASLSHAEVDGYRDHSRVENLVFNSRFGWAIDESSDLGAVVSVVHSPQADDPGGLTAAEVDADRRRAAPNNVLYDAGESVDQQQFGLRYRKTWGGDHAIDASNYYVWRQFDNRLPFLNGGTVALDRFFAGGGLRYAYTGDVFGLENRLMLGFELEAQRDHRWRFDNEEGQRGAETLDQHEDVTSMGYYAQNELRLAEDVELLLGVRYDRVAFEVDDRFRSDGDDSGDIVFDEWSPRVGALYSPHPAVHLFANVATSFETPTTTELANPDGSGGFDPDLEAQTAWTAEAGLKGGIAGWLRYEAVGFYIEVDDELIPYELDTMPGRTFFENAGRSKRAGLELAASLQPCAGVTASAAYTYSHFRFDRFRTDDGAFDGNAIPGIPRDHFWAELAWEHPLGFYASWDVTYAGAFYADNANDVETDSFVVSDLRVGWTGHFHGFEIGPFFGIQNVFAETYDDNVRLNAGFGRYFEPAPRRQLFGGIQLGYRFGGVAP